MKFMQKVRVKDHLLDLNQVEYRFRDSTILTIVHHNQLRGKFAIPYTRKIRTDEEMLRLYGGYDSPIDSGYDNHKIYVTLKKGFVWIIFDESDIIRR